MKIIPLLSFNLLFLFASIYGKKPNILFIMSDDHAAHAISAYGGRLAKVAPTPNLDRLAKEGALFKMLFVRIQFALPPEPVY